MTKEDVWWELCRARAYASAIANLLREAENADGAGHYDTDKVRVALDWADAITRRESP